MLQPQLSSSYGSVSAGALPPVMRRNTVSDSGSNHPAPEIARRLEFERSVSSNNLTTSSPGAVDSPRSRPAGTAPPMATGDPHTILTLHAATVQLHAIHTNTWGVAVCSMRLCCVKL
jgi:hypothetical protein